MLQFHTITLATFIRRVTNEVVRGVRVRHAVLRELSLNKGSKLNLRDLLTFKHGLKV